MKMPSEAKRARIYEVLFAAQPLIIWYGLASSEETALWLGFVSAVLGLGLARVNTSTKQ